MVDDPDEPMEGASDFPAAVGLMSGRNSPLEVAFTWCGWRCRTYELEGTPFDPPKDLLDPAVRAEAEYDIEVADLVTFQMDGKTFSKVREIPMRGSARHIKSLPLRASGKHLRGLPRLNREDAAKDKQEVNEANELLDWGLEQLHKKVDSKDAALMENSEGSYAWEFERAQELLAKGCEDYDHASCAHGGARAKKQRWRGNVPEVRQRRADCHHLHSADEWQPKKVSKAEVKLAAHEEKEYTAHHSFYMAVQCSIWAVRTGKAKLALPRIRILPQETGSRVGWTKMPPEALREWAMPGFGLRLQLEPPASIPGTDYRGLPRILCLETVESNLPQQALYVGAGSAKWKLPRTHWYDLYNGCADGEPEYCIAKFLEFIQGNEKVQQIFTKEALEEPWHQTLLVDTSPGWPSHAEAIARWFWAARSPTLTAKATRKVPPVQEVEDSRPMQPRVIPPRIRPPGAGGNGPQPTTKLTPVKGKGIPSKARGRGTGRRAGPVRGIMMGAALPSVGASLQANVVVEWRWSDTTVHRAIRKLFPEEMLRGFQLPPLEDLVNDERLAAWRIWAELEGVAQAPIQAQTRATGWNALAVGKQRGATGSKHALDPAVGFGMGKHEHFEAACSASEQFLDPYSLEAKAAPDLRFAAEKVVENSEAPRKIREQLRGLVKELSQRTKPLSARLRDWQPWHVRRVAGKLQLGFVVIVCLLILWGDGKMPGRFVSGFQGGDRLEESRPWKVIDEPEPIPETEVFAKFPANKEELMRRPIEDEAEFLWESCEKEVAKQVGLRAVPESALKQKYGAGQYSAIPCFVHVQACGKKRRIDNARKSRDNEATQYTEKFRLANAYAPALSARLLFRAGRKAGLSEAQVWALMDLESGGEDLPDAFRSIPVEQQYLRRNIVMLKHPSTGKLWFFQMLAALFGQGSSVYSFERWSAFLEAAPRRLLWLLWVMYVDDGSLVDLTGAKGSGQALIHEFFEAIGTGLSPDKRTWMNKRATFLGVDHSLEELTQLGYVDFWPKGEIEQELRAQMAKFRSTRQCPPGDASKFRGVAGFAAESQFGQLGKAPMRPFKQRQYWDVPPWVTTNTMDRSMKFMDMLLDLKLSRKVHVVPDGRPALVVASDAQVEPGSWPGGGVLIFDPDGQQKYGGWMQFKAGALGVWDLSYDDLQSGKQPFALCEAAMVPLALMSWPERVRGRRIVWYVDNTAAMSAFVKGASANEHLEHIVGLFWMLAWHLDVQVWFEWVDSRVTGPMV